MPRSQRAVNGEGHEDPLDDASPDAAPSEPSADARADQPDLMTKAITVGVIGVGVALFEAALIPGMIIGVAAMLAPKALPKLGAGVQPIFRSAVRGAYKAGQRARHAFAEAQEQVHDIVAETNTEAAGSSGTMGPGDAVKA